MQNISDNKLLLAKINDKLSISKSKNRITNSDFMNEYQIEIVKEELRKNKAENYIIFGGYDGAKREIVIAYPEKINEEITKKTIENILIVIRIELPFENYGRYQHKDYLGTIMSFGLTRERVGDIIVYNDSAYIVVLAENAEYIKSSFELERRFKKAKITIISINNIKVKKEEFEEMEISVSSFRLDNVISEILNTSRRISQQLIEDERVFLNYVLESKIIKLVKEGDLLTIRGKGKFIIDKVLRKNRKGKEVILIKKYK